jgi:hypothetical protein
MSHKFQGIEKEITALFFGKAMHASTEHRLKLLWGFIKADQIDFRQFQRLLYFIVSDAGSVPLEEKDLYL